MQALCPICKGHWREVCGFQIISTFNAPQEINYINGFSLFSFIAFVVSGSVLCILLARIAKISALKAD
jgi:hypothetical protein